MPAELESQLVESITSMRTVKSFGMEDIANMRTENPFCKYVEQYLQFWS